MCDATWDVMQCQMRCEMWRYDVEWRCGTCGIWWCADAKCSLWDTEWCGMVWRHIKHGGVMWCRMMAKMQCGMCGVLWNVCCGIVWCVIYMWMWCAWRGVRWNVGVMWNGVLRLVWWSDLVWIMVRCEMWCDVKCCNFRHGATEMQNVRCGIWCGVELNVVSWYVKCCIMQDVESCNMM